MRERGVFGDPKRFVCDAECGGDLLAVAIFDVKHSDYLLLARREFSEACLKTTHSVSLFFFFDQLAFDVLRRHVFRQRNAEALVPPPAFPHAIAMRAAVEMPEPAFRIVEAFRAPALFKSFQGNLLDQILGIRLTPESEQSASKQASARVTIEMSGRMPVAGRSYLFASRRSCVMT